YGASYKAMKARQANWLNHCTQFDTNDRFFNQWIMRNQMDLGTLVVDSVGGPLITAGIPWYAVPFGRDSLITCLQAMIVQPEIAKGTLRFLAHWQGQEVNDWRDEEPGKILHEVRQGQLANLGKIPHTPYYGTIDATPLFIVLLGEYERWTGDAALIDELWEPMERALTWIDRFGDLDGDGYIEYLCRSPRGLAVQGWKDSHDSVIHLDGRVATGPIALVEVQGYVYHAKRSAARLYRIRGLRAIADRLEQEAADLKARFNRDFFLEDANYYALALDGDKQAVRTITSNPGHGLWSGIIAPDRAMATANWLLAPDMFSGWGIRTVSNEMKAFNPMSYHNGTVWPHDNSIIAKGLADYGYKKEACQILEALYEASWHFPYYRLPELFCGFTRGGELDVPVRYPVACSPQAWAAAGAFMMLQAVLGIEADAANNLLHIHEPMLPVSLERLDVRRLRVGQSTIDLRFTRRGTVTGCEVLSKDGPLRVMIEV
ncbi:MAG: amylo-alpha-1,6-glucosidase, partial [Candidatus Sericytochromatia bacterium]|nr:amylo-alpha-1,6-glucosidase [Candidatus Sericytochromatia bacterium]